MMEMVAGGSRGFMSTGIHLLFQALAGAIYFRKLVLHVLRYGIGRICPVCGHACRLFQSAGPTRRPDAECPKCGSRERHRFLWRFLERELDQNLPDALVLHVAPEPFLEPALRNLIPSMRYVSGDLSSSEAMVRFDLTKLPLAHAVVDLVICSHVLEHIPDDQSAMRELARILSPQGIALIVVPMTMGKTREDLSITDPAERARRYGQEDHVRLYGDDIAERLEMAGLTVSKVFPGDVLTASERRRCGVPDWVEPIFVCRRRV
jgi:hypothetical protein